MHYIISQYERRWVLEMLTMLLRTSFQESVNSFVYARMRFFNAVYLNLSKNPTVSRRYLGNDCDRIRRVKRRLIIALDEFCVVLAVDEEVW